MGISHATQYSEWQWVACLREKDQEEKCNYHTECIIQCNLFSKRTAVTELSREKGSDWDATTSSLTCLLAPFVNSFGVVALEAKSCTGGQRWVLSINRTWINENSWVSFGKFWISGSFKLKIVHVDRRSRTEEDNWKFSHYYLTHFLEFRVPDDLTVVIIWLIS